MYACNEGFFHGYIIFINTPPLFLTVLVIEIGSSSTASTKNVDIIELSVLKANGKLTKTVRNRGGCVYKNDITMKKTLITGIHAVESVLKNDPDNITQVWIAENKRNLRVKELINHAQKRGLIAHRSDMAQLDKLAKTHQHQGVVAEYNAPASYNENDLLDLLENIESTPLLLVLDGVTDPHNLGACLRTAEGAGVHAVIAPKDNAVGLTPAARKVASGAAETVPFVQVTNLVRTMEKIKKMGIWFIGTSDKASGDLYTQNFKAPTAIVMGAEGKGLRRLTEEHCDELISIPMAGQVSSLNVSVATGVCLYEVVRQRQG